MYTASLKFWGLQSVC